MVEEEVNQFPAARSWHSNPGLHKAVTVERHFMQHAFAAILVIFLASCNGDNNVSKLDSSSNKESHSQPKIMPDYSPQFEKAHPVAKSLMAEDFYWNPIEETSPFGNDDGADCYAGFAEWREDNSTGDPTTFLKEQLLYWGYRTFDLNETDYKKLKSYLDQSETGLRTMNGIDAAIVSIAFGQIYLEGTVDTRFKELAKTAIKRELIPEMLAFWRDEYKPKREMQLSKMQDVLAKVK